VLDFGLAKALGPDPSGTSGADPTNSPTLTAHSTQLGMIIGTAAYMSPEQARAARWNRRADIWAFGVVLFEMVTGKRGYEAEDISETLAAVLHARSDWKALPADTPARLKALVRDCLVRDPKERLRDIGDAAASCNVLIEGAPEATAAAGATAPPAPAWQRLAAVGRRGCRGDRGCGERPDDAKGAGGAARGDTRAIGAQEVLRIHWTSRKTARRRRM
jgi:serine/threonine-protein kinase